MTTPDTELVNANEGERGEVLIQIDHCNNPAVR